MSSAAELPVRETPDEHQVAAQGHITTTPMDPFAKPEDKTETSHEEPEAKVEAEEEAQTVETDEATVEIAEPKLTQVPEETIEEAPELTLEQVFDYGASGDPIPDDVGLTIINKIAKAFGAEDPTLAGELASRFMQGQEALVHLHRMQLISEALPSWERYGELIEWAGANPETAKAEAYNEALASAKTFDDQKAALVALHNRYEAHFGARGAEVQGTPTAVEIPPGVDPIRTRTEKNRLFADPRYMSDPAFKDDVRKRLKAGIDLGVYNSEA